ncbi:hypothetical protein EDM52_18445 [Brevibacillus invocatus]|uniref:Uncharacterized protein n=1 Tax=Brevibacillus invocatus TaxID=173959 RepID=A0A3M8C2P3_9BACL|nr:hypothetical protein [Brevibacillus invocatus]RNB69949.1 hypothetical protein EDM52_18445 [Brevibacillus invocatus]
MKLADAKKLISELQYFVDLVESYEPSTFETNIIREYAIHGNVNEVAKIMNELGFQVNGKKVNSSDVSEVLKQKPSDELHKIVSRTFKNNKKAVQKFT